MGELLKHPGVRKRAAEKRSADGMLAANEIGSLRVTEHGHTRRRVADRGFVASVILWDEPMPPHGTNNTLDRCTLPEGPNECGMEHPLADVRLNGHKHWPVREYPQEFGYEHAVVGESESESMEEHNRPCLGVFGIPVRRDADHVLDIPMHSKLDTPVVFQELVSESVGNGDEYVPEEGAK